VLDIVVHQNIGLWQVISDILNSDHLPVVFTYWERFQKLSSNLISPRTEINCGVEADKAALEFAASIASAFRLSTSKITISVIFLV
jgi:hypothetical protein